MKKRFFAALLALTMVIAMLPGTVSAAAADHAVQFKLVKDTTTVSGKELLRVDFEYKSGASDTAHILAACLKYDATLIYPITTAGIDLTSYLDHGDGSLTPAYSFSTDLNAALARNPYQTVVVDPILGSSSTDATVTVNAGIWNNVGFNYWMVKINGTSKPSIPDFTRVSSLFFGLKEGVTFDSIPEDLFAISDPLEDEAYTKQSYGVEISANGGALHIGYLPDSKNVPANVLATTPAFVAGEGVKFAGSEPEVPEELKLTLTANKGESGVSATATLANNFKTGDPQSALVIVAAYDADGLVAVNSGTQTVATGASIDLGLTVTEDFAGITEVKAFLWSDFANRTPLCGAEVVSFTAGQ